MKEFIIRNKKIFVIVSLSLIVISLLGGTYAMFQRLDKAEYANNYKTGLLQIELDDTSEGLGGVLDLSGTVPISDEAGTNTNAYKFKLVNKGNLSYKFNLKLLSDVTYLEEHNCLNNQVNYDYIKIKINDNEPVVLSSLTDNIIDKDIILNPGESKYYELRVWLKEGTPNTEIGKHYHAKVSIDGSAMYTNEYLFDIANGSIFIDDGSSDKNIKVKQGNNDYSEIERYLPIVITGNTNTNAIKINASNAKVNIKDLTIDLYNNSNGVYDSNTNKYFYGAIHNDGNNTIINFTGTNIIYGDNISHFTAGIYNNNDSTITFEGSGSLETKGGGNCASIGGYYGGDDIFTYMGGGNIVINSGTISASIDYIGSVSDKIGAGLGSAGVYAPTTQVIDNMREGKTITINGGNVTAQGGVCASSIGGGGVYYGRDYNGSYVRIKAGSVKYNTNVSINTSNSPCDNDEFQYIGGLGDDGGFWKEEDVIMID